MIFISAQPDTNYFIWQLEIQLRNFSKFGISPSQIHVVVSYAEQKGINSAFWNFSRLHLDFANFFFYPDKRESDEYKPSIRPHILKQHFAQNQWLSGQSIFYHDSDIVFTIALPDFKRLCNDNVWYFSNARDYLSIQYINGYGSTMLEKMCDIVNVRKSLVIQNDSNVGGAQAILKGINEDFWDKIEKDSNALFKFLSSCLSDSEKFKSKNTNKLPISTWCADMWALLWNAYNLATVKTDSELDFCWPHNAISEWNNKYIFHNAAVIEDESKKMFYKPHFYEIAPYDTNFDRVSKSLCSYQYLKMIESYGKSKIYDCHDVSFLIPIRIDSKDRLENLNTILRFISEKFICKVLLYEGDKESKINRESLPDIVDYKFHHDLDAIFYRQKYNNQMVMDTETPIVIKYDCDVIVPPSQLYTAVTSLRNNECDICYPYDGNFCKIDGLLRDHFIKTLDIKVLDKFTRKTWTGTPSYGGCSVLNKKSFIKIGLDNTKFHGWAHEDQEIYKRASILGFKVHRTPGALYHLEHKRGSNSYFADDDTKYNSYAEYIKVCNLTKSELLNYINQ